MTEQQAIELISAQLATNWQTATGLDPAAQLALENDALPSADTFGQLTVRHNTSQLLTAGPVGQRKFERRGTIYVKLWTPVNQGRKGFSTLADAVRTIYEGLQLSTGGNADQLTVYAGLTREVGDQDGRWYVGAIQFPFVYHATG